jgi:hypothetical protein
MDACKSPRDQRLPPGSAARRQWWDIISSVSHWPKGRFSRQQIVPPYDVPVWLAAPGTHDILVAQIIKQLGSGGMLIRSQIPLAAVPQVPHQAVNIGPAHLLTLRHHPFSFDSLHVPYTNPTFRSLRLPVKTPTLDSQDLLKGL